MAERSDDRRKVLRSVYAAARLGLAAAVFFTLVSWLVAAIIKGLVTNFTNVWPEWFPGHLVDAVLSGWWAILIVVSFTAVGVLIGALWPQRYELL